MSVVVDSSVLVIALVDLGPHGAWAEASAAHEDLMLLDMQLFSFEPFADRIWELHGPKGQDAKF